MRQLLFKRVLAASARRYAAAGWPIAAGAWWDGQRYRCPAAACRITGHHPAGHGEPADSASVDAGEVAGWWAAHPHTLILPTGLGVDVLDVDSALGRAAWQRLHDSGMTVPAATLPTSRLLLFVATGPAAGLRTHYPAGAGPVHHSRGSYVIVPPSRLQHGRVRWVRAPWVQDWTLPDPQPVLDAIAAADLAHAADARPPAGRR